jgi:hypothetical protein
MVTKSRSGAEGQWAEPDPLHLSAPSPGELGVWAVSDVTGTLAAYEL